MIDVTAAIAPAAPNLRSQIAAARSIGSNGRPSGLRTATTYRRGPGSPRAPARPPANPMARVARREPAPARPCPCRCRFVPHHGDNLHRYTRAPPVTSWTRMFTASYIPLLGENVTEARSGAYMQSGHAATAYAPVLAAGVGVRHGSGWALRSVTFRLDRSDLGSAALGIVSRRPAASASLIDVLTGLAQLDYGSLRVLGQDMSTARGRSIARPQVGIARRIGRLQPACRIRGLVEHAARLARQPGQDRQLLVAAILDRLALAPWADVPVRAAPDLVVARDRIAAAAVHQPSLLLIDGLLDDLWSGSQRSPSLLLIDGLLDDLCEPDQAI